MNSSGKATRLSILSFATVPMRAFHVTWMAFFVCFFAWFAAAPLMPVIKGDLGLNMDQIANINIAAVAVTILVRILIGPLCDRIGSRRAYTMLLAFGSIPVIGIGFANSYEAFLLFRLAIGAVGASFVITQYHTSVMFAPNVVGAANATAAGWGNAGGGAAQAIMPLILAAIVSLGVEPAFGWRVAMIVPGVLMLVLAIVYYRTTQDLPGGNLSELRAAGVLPPAGSSGRESFIAAARDYRVWMLFMTYAACFGVELTVHNIAAIYYVDRFGLDLRMAGLYAGSFGLLALFARALGGLLSDRVAGRFGLDGRTLLLFALIVAEGLGLMLFAKADVVGIAVFSMLGFGLFTHMACGATYSLVPFINRRALGGVAGIVGAGGNVGAVAAGFLMKGTESIQHGLFVLGGVVTATALCAIAVRFSMEHKAEEERLYNEAVAQRDASAA